MTCPSQPCSGKGAGGGGGARETGQTLSPWPVRMAVFVLLAALAVAAIWVIDRHAMALMQSGSAPAARNY